MFEYLKKQDLADKSDWLEMPLIVAGAKLHLRPAMLTNSAYYNATLKLSARRSAGSLPKHMEQQDEIRQGRNDDRVTYPGTVLVGWEGILDDKREPVEFSKEAAADLLEALPDWMFDMVRAHAMDPTNFVKTGDPVSPTPEQIQDKAGNSQSDSSGS